MARPKHLTWEESASYTLTLATAYRMLFGLEPHRLEAGRQRAGLGRLRRPRRVRRAALRGGRRQCDRRDLRRIQARVRDVARREGRAQPQGFQLLGPIAEGQFARVRRLHGRGAEVRKGDLGNHRQAGCRHGVRASRRGDVPDLVFRRQARRHGGVLRGHHRLQPDVRRALRLDAAEAHPGLAFRQSEAGLGRQQVRDRAPHRSLHVRSVPLGADSARAHQDVEEPARARQHGGARQRAAHGPSHVRGRGRGGEGGSLAGSTATRPPDLPLPANGFTPRARAP